MLQYRSMRTPLVATLASLINATTPHLITAIRTGYILAATAVIIVRLVPSLRSRFLSYGARTASSGTKDSSSSEPTSPSLLDGLASSQVQHSSFKHFYLLSILCSAFWLLQETQESTRAIDYVHSAASAHYPSTYTPVAKSFLCLFLLLAQALRRYDECTNTNNAPSTSTMWVGQYYLGLLFYITTNVAIIVEHHPLSKQSYWVGEGLNLFGDPYFVGAFLTFLLAGYKQHEFHEYLGTLQKYTLPNAGSFRTIVAPHYTAECGIYLALAVMSAPTGHVINKTMVCAAVFVIVNLGVTAEGTKTWMEEKFQDEKDAKEVKRRWRMVPYVW